MRKAILFLLILAALHTNQLDYLVRDWIDNTEIRYVTDGQTHERRQSIVWASRIYVEITKIREHGIIGEETEFDTSPYGGTYPIFFPASNQLPVFEVSIRDDLEAGEASVIDRIWNAPLRVILGPLDDDWSNDEIYQVRRIQFDDLQVGDIVCVRFLGGMPEGNVIIGEPLECLTEVSQIIRLDPDIIPKDTNESMEDIDRKDLLQ